MEKESTLLKQILNYLEIYSFPAILMGALCCILGPAGRQQDYSLNISPPEREHRSGDNIDITCQSNEQGVITSWSKPSGRLADNVQNVGGTLRIINLRSENAGMYRCEATGQQGFYYKDYNLDVIGIIIFIAL